jgi:NAD(P)-dependent dehydrogenase (short-subunit alcohol dehydrogenase family)
MPLAADALRLDGRVVVVTGAARGIGEAVAVSCAELGAEVALCDRDAEHLERVAERVRALDRRVHTGVLDVRDGDAVSAFADSTASAFGRVDGLVNNAGGGFAASFLDVNEKGQDALVRENFTSVASMTRAFVALMPPPGSGRSGGGSIVNITSIEAHRAGPNFAVYSAMKAAVANLTMSLALELGDRHIRVNCVAPDVIPTPGVGEMPVKTPLPYPGDVDDVAAAVAYLLSDAAGFVSGTTLHVDGGNRAAGGWRRAADGSFTT